MENDTIQILELFGGIGSPRCALRNLNIPTKAIDYVEINEKAVQSYNSMFREELAYKTQTVVGWNLKPDILIHGSPCQDMSIAGHQGKATGEGRINRGKGSDEGSGTRSSLMWETIHIIENMGEWRPRYVIWENVKNVKSKYMRPNFDRYMVEMERLGYTNNFEVLDAREFGLPQARERVFTVSVLNGERFEFNDLIRTPMRNLQEFLEDDTTVRACLHRRKRHPQGNGYHRLCIYNHDKTRPDTCTSHRPRRWTLSVFNRAGMLAIDGIYRRGFRQSESSSAEEREILQSTIRPSRKQHRRSNIREHIQKNNIA